MLSHSCVYEVDAATEQKYHTLQGSEKGKTMYDLNKLNYFTTVGELRMLLAEIPDNAEVSVGGADAYIHVSPDNELITFDCDDLKECYDEWYSVDEEHYKDFWEGQEALIMLEHKMRRETLKL